MSLIALAVFGLPIAVGAIATAQSRTDAAGTSTINAIGWMNVRDSAGVAVSDYVFVTDHGGLLHPGNTAMATVLDLEFAGFMAIGVTAIWLIGYGLSFRWLELVSAPLSGVARALSGQIGTPLVIAIAAAVGALCVAWFVLRGWFGKATLQVVTMVGVAIFGVGYLADPMADVLSPHGLLAHGRDVGVAVAAGLNGDANPDPRALITSLESTLADNFVRHPLQVWNFGHVVDESPACRAAWSAGVAAGSDNRVTSGLQRCGDSAAYTKSRSPNAGQVCTGLLLLLFAAVLLLFGVYLSGKIVLAAAESIYHAFMAIFGFAAGGFVYGPTQTFLVRNVVDAFVSAGKMMAFTIYLGVYALVLDDLFRQTSGHGIQVIVLGGAMMMVGVVLLRRVGRNVAARGDRAVAQIGSMLAGAPATAGATAAGTGPGAGSQHLLTTLAAMNTVNANPLTEYLMGGKRSPLSARSGLRQQAENANMRLAVESGRRGWLLNYNRTREQIIDSARSAAAEYGHTPMGAAVAVDRVIDRGGGMGDLDSALTSAGFANQRIRLDAIRAYNYRTSWGPNMWDGDKHLGQAIASMGVLKLGRTPANIALFQRTAHRLANRRFADPELRFSSFDAAERELLRGYFAAPSRAVIEGINQVATGAAATLPGIPGAVTADRAALMNRFINVHLSRRYLEAARVEDFSTASEILRTMALPEYWLGTSRLTPSKAVPSF